MGVWGLGLDWMLEGERLENLQIAQAEGICLGERKGSLQPAIDGLVLAWL